MDKDIIVGKTFPSVGQAVLLVLAVLVIQVANGIGVSLIDRVLRNAGVEIQTPLVAQPICLAVTNIIAFGLPLLFGVLYQNAKFTEVFPLRRPRSPLVVLGIMLAIIGAVVLSSEVDNLTRMFFPVPDWISSMFGYLGNAKAHLVQSAFLLVVVAPVTEEFFFRGLILRGLLSRYSKGWAVVLTALLFTVIHVNPWQFFSAMLLGTLTGWWFVRAQTLTVCLIGHAFANGFVLLQPFIPFEVRGFNTDPALATPGQLQPLWFDGIGLLLFLSGLLLFHLSCNREKKTNMFISFSR